MREADCLRHSAAECDRGTGQRHLAHARFRSKLKDRNLLWLSRTVCSCWQDICGTGSTEDEPPSHRDPIKGLRSAPARRHDLPATTTAKDDAVSHRIKIENSPSVSQISSSF